MKRFTWNMFYLDEVDRETPDEIRAANIWVWVEIIDGKLVLCWKHDIPGKHNGGSYLC